MNPHPHDVSPMVATYKRLFVILSLITLIGIAVAVVHVPIGVLLSLGLAFMLIKAMTVYRSFQHLLTGRKLIVIVFILTAIFVAGLLLLPVLNRQDYLVGTQDTSRPLMIEHKE